MKKENIIPIFSYGVVLRCEVTQTMKDQIEDQLNRASSRNGTVDYIPNTSRICINAEDCGMEKFCFVCKSIDGEDGELKLRKCGRCRTIRYCSRFCQRLHWKGEWCGDTHKQTCKEKIK